MIMRAVEAGLWLLLLLNSGLIAAGIYLDNLEAAGRGIWGALAAVLCLLVLEWIR